ncbi:MAG TPA: acyltransferase family protein [Bacteroidetes bacterium]|nr:acyltransferase family protein [Bacteroidota bacterium]
MDSIIKTFTPPPSKIVHDILTPFRLYFDPKLYGLENAKPEKPAMYVSHHTVYGLTDGFYLGGALYEQKGIFMRALIDNMHTVVPVWRKIVQDLGMVPASREACAELMKAKQHIMVFPGGTREAFKNKDEEYQLLWKQRTGFAHMAIEHGYDIVPVASIGGEEMYKILVDSKEIMNSPIGALLKRSGISDQYLKGGENIPPIAKGVGFTGLPKPERLYIMLGDHIETGGYAGKEDDQDALFELRGKVETSILGMIDELKAFRRNDTDEEWWRKLLKRL